MREFTGEAQLNADSIGTSSLLITAKTASMEETSSVFTDAQNKIINKELREIVLLPDQYPDIVFKSAAVKRLLRNQDDIGNAIKPYYGDAAGDKLTALLKEHITTAAEVVTAAKANDSANVGHQS